MNYFDILLTNALISQTPLIYKAYQYFKGNMESYKNRIVEAIQSLKEENVETAGIVSDNLCVQVSSIKLVQNEYPIFHIPCGAHMLQFLIHSRKIAN